MNKTRAHSAVPGTDLVRLRLALTAFFALDGFVFAGWVVRIPAIKEQTGASASALGLALLGVSAGAVITMTLTGGCAAGTAATWSPSSARCSSASAWPCRR